MTTFIIGIICYSIGYFIKSKELSDALTEVEQLEAVNKDLLIELDKYRDKYYAIISKGK
jgi:hypothetical protein